MARLALFVLVLLVAGGCASAPSGLDGSPLVGRWAMERVLDQGADVSAEANPARDRYIVLRPDGTFESGGQPYGRNTGTWVYNTRTRRLGLDSDLGPDDDSTWAVSLRGDTMEWAGVGSEFARRFRITSRRVR